MKTGHIDPVTKKRVTSDIGTPQGSVLSPLLSNIVLHDLDLFMERIRATFRKGDKIRPNPPYVKLNSKRRYIRDLTERKKILRDMRKLLASDPRDPNFRRLKYVRYADDFVILVIGSHNDAVKIRAKVKDFLENYGLDLNINKTIITNIQKEGFKFIGADCNRAKMTQNHVVKLKDKKSVRATTRLRVNIDLKKVYKKLVSSGVAKYDTKKNRLVPRGTAKLNLINLSHYEIVSFYNSKMRGLYNFYSFAGNRKRLNLVF